MSISYNVTFWKTRHRPEKNKPYQVRWVVEGGAKTPFTKAFINSDLADSFRSELLQAANKGEPFDTETGMPLAKLRAEEQRKKSVSWYKHAVDYVDYKWLRVSAHQRRSNAETLVDATCALIPMKDSPGRKLVRTALKRWAFQKPGQEAEPPPPDVQKALDWVEAVSPPLADLAEPEVVSRVLDRFAHNLDGRPAAPDYRSRRQRVFYNVLKYAVKKERLTSHPLANPRLDWEPPADLRSAVKVVDPRVVGSTEQIEEMLAAVTYVGRQQGPRFLAFFGCMFYGMLRPEEVAGLTEDACELPATGWGRLYAGATRSAVGRDWTDTGEVHDSRGLKQRSRKDTRPVPIHPKLVAMLRWHIDTYGVGPGGELFRSVNGNPIHPSTYDTVWRKAREFGLAPKDRRMVLKRPYDLRHAGVTARLYAGVPERQVAEWAGHSVEILRRTYSKILAGFEDTWHARMDRIFGSADEGAGNGGAAMGPEPPADTGA